MAAHFWTSPRGKVHRSLGADGLTACGRQAGSDWDGSPVRDYSLPSQYGSSLCERCFEHGNIMHLTTQASEDRPHA